NLRSAILTPPPPPTATLFPYTTLFRSYRLERSPDAEDPEHLVTGGREQSGPVEHQSGQGTGIVMGSLDARALTGLEPIECGDRVITVSGDLVGEHRGRFHGHARADACCREEPGRG